MALCTAVGTYSSDSISPEDGQEIRAVKIAVENDHDVVGLVRAGLELTDVFVHSNSSSFNNMYKVEWNRENGFVTALVPGGDIDRISNNFQLIGVKPHLERHPDDLPGELDEIILFEQSWGWPETLDGHPSISHQVPTLSDLDGNGDLEIVLHSIEGYINAWQHTGAMVPGYPVDPITNGRDYTWISTVSWETGAAINLADDEGDAVIFGTGPGLLLGIHYDPTYNHGPEWQDVGQDIFTGVPAVYDLDGDGHEELIVNSYDPFVNANRVGEVHIYERHGIEVINGWPQSYPNPTSSSPVVGDINGDGSVEILIGMGNSLDTEGGIYAWNADGSPLDGWPVTGYHTIGGNITLVDIDGLPGLEVVVRCMSLDGVNGIYAWHGDGTLVDGFPIEVNGGHPYGSVAVADMDENGLLDFAIGTVDYDNGAAVYVYEETNGLREGYPRYPGNSWIGGSPVFADVNGDALPEVVVSQERPTWTVPPRVMAYDHEGYIAGKAFIDEDDDGYLMSSPTAYDLNGDGNVQIIAASSSGKLYVWDTPGIPTGNMFPCEKGNMRRTGAVEIDHFGLTDADEVYTHNLPVKFSISSVYPNPFNSTTEILFSLPEDGLLDIRVFDLLGREAAVLQNSHFEAGHHNVVWQAGKDIPSGIYFVVGSFKGIKSIRKVVFLK